MFLLQLENLLQENTRLLERAQRERLPSTKKEVIEELGDALPQYALQIHRAVSCMEEIDQSIRKKNAGVVTPLVEKAIHHLTDVKLALYDMTLQWISHLNSIMQQCRRMLDMETRPDFLFFENQDDRLKQIKSMCDCLEQDLPKIQTLLDSISRWMEIEARSEVVIASQPYTLRSSVG